MRKIAIIGCGTSAMILSHALLNHGGFEVTVFSEKTANQWYEGPPTGTPFVADENIDIERELGIEHWEDEILFGDGIMLDFRSNKGAEPLTIRGRFAKLGAAVDLRTRVQRWMNDFVARGGRLVIERVNPERVDAISRSADLTVLATGKGELGALIEHDPEGSELRRVIALQELASSWLEMRYALRIGILKFLCAGYWRTALPQNRQSVSHHEVTF